MTNSLPVADKLSGIPGVETFLLGGQYLPKQSALMGGKARRALGLHRIDLAFLSAEGADREGVWNSQEDIIAFQLALVAHAARSVLVIDRTKIGHRAANFLIRWSEVGLLISDASPRELRDAGIPSDPPRVLSTQSSP